MRLLLLVLAGCSSTSSDPRTLHNRGVVTADSRAYKSGTQTYGQGTVTAGFFREQTDPFVGCSSRSFGACNAHFDCQPVRSDPPTDGGLNPYASAGDITVEGLPATVKLTQMTMGMFVGQYTLYQQFMPMFSGGEQLTVVAAGNEVPAFVGYITTPSQPTITAPVSASTIMVPRNQDLSFTWQNGGAGELRVSLVVPQMMSYPGIDCAWPASGSAGSIPSEALQMLPLGGGQLSFSVVASNELFAGAWQVLVAATTGAVRGNGSAYDFASVMLQ